MGASRGDFIKFPRTPHVVGSCGTDDDCRLSEAESQCIMTAANLVCSEKLDGANVGIHFSAQGGVVLQCRGHILGEREHPQFQVLKTWSFAHRDLLESALGIRYVLFGEWLYCVHHVHYDALPHYLVVFDVYDKDTGTFLDTRRRNRIADMAGIPVVPEVRRGPLESFEALRELIGRSRFGQATMEGVYVKGERGGIVEARAKFVRRDFTEQVMSSGKAWRRHRIETNQLAPGANVWL